VVARACSGSSPCKPAGAPAWAGTSDSAGDIYEQQQGTVRRLIKSTQRAQSARSEGAPVFHGAPPLEQRHAARRRALTVLCARERERREEARGPRADDDDARRLLGRVSGRRRAGDQVAEGLAAAAQQALEARRVEPAWRRWMQNVGDKTSGECGV
jgi:hypothetical protein